MSRNQMSRRKVPGFHQTAPLPAIRPRPPRRTAADRPQDDAQPGGADEGIDRDEEDDREQDIPGRHDRRHGLRGPQDLVDRPGLPADLGRDPAGLVGQVGEGHGEEEQLQIAPAPGQLLLRQEPDAGRGHEDEHQSQEDHHVVSRERQEDGRTLVLGELGQAEDPAVRIEVDEQAQHLGDADREEGPLVLLVGDAEDGERRAVPGLPEGLEGGHLLRLGARHLDGVGVAGAELEDRGRGEHGQRGLHEQGGLFDRPPLQQEPGRDGHGHEGARDPAAEDGVDIADDGRRIQRRLPEVVEDGPAALHAEPGRRLHPGIGDDDPQARKVGAEEDEEGREPVGLRRDPVPAEDEDAQEHGLEEEGEDGLGGEGRAEDVADRPRE